MPTRKISSTVDVKMFQLAQDMTGAGQAETIRQALNHFIHNPPATRAAPIATSRAAPVAVSRAMPVAASRGAPMAFVQETAKPVTEMTNDEKQACLMLMSNSRSAIGDSLAYLVGEEAVADIATKKRLRILIGDLEAKEAKINARITAFLAEQLTMVPPSTQIIAEISQLAEKVGQLTLEAQRADQVITAVKSVVQIWTGTQV